MKRIVLLLILAIVVAACDDIKSNTEINNPNTDSINIITDSINTIADSINSNTENSNKLPKGAQRMDHHDQYAIYVNKEGIYDDVMKYYIWSVWLVDENIDTVCKLCTTNPAADGQWERMQHANSDAVDVPIDMIATADTAFFFPGDVTKVVIEGCPDCRNIWTYIIDSHTLNAKQFPSTEGTVSCDWEAKEIVLSSYGYYEEGGRYNYMSAYDAYGKFLRRVGKIQPE